MKKAYNIYGMHCAGCVNSAEKALKRVPGVLSAEVQLTTEKATVEFDSSVEKIPLKELKEAIEFAGFELAETKHRKVIYNITGMHCAGCVSAVERAVKSVDAVERVSVNLANETVQIEFTGSDDILELIEKRVTDSGYNLKKKVLRD